MYGQVNGKRGPCAREIRKRLETATQNAMSRLGQNFSQDNMVLEISDVIGQDPRLSSDKLKRVLKEIDEKIGWKRVKERVQELVESAVGVGVVSGWGQTHFPLLNYK